MKILLTGASGMLGRYIQKEFADAELHALPGSDILDFRNPLDEGVLPEGNNPEEAYDLVIHAAGTTEDTEADEVNIGGTRHFLKALSSLRVRPKALCFISCSSVYKPIPPKVTEETGKRLPGRKRPYEERKATLTDEQGVTVTPEGPYCQPGLSKLKAEEECRLWSEAAGVPLTILRPGLIFGTGIKGPMARMFQDVIRGRYIKVRGEEGTLALVTAIDVAKAIRITIGQQGIFNVSDGNAPTWGELAEAMTANAGAMKRMTVLPAPWADAAWKFCRALPAVAASLSPETRRSRNSDRALLCTKIEAIESWKPYDTLRVIARSCTDYPYEIK